jgi:hypothetical protein
VIEHLGYPVPLFDAAVQDRILHAVARLTSETRVRNVLILNLTMMSSSDKDDIRDPMRYALDVRKFQLEHKREQDDDHGIIPLSRGLAGIAQHNHKLTSTNPR